MVVVQFSWVTVWVPSDMENLCVGGTKPLHNHTVTLSCEKNLLQTNNYYISFNTSLGELQ